MIFNRRCTNLQKPQCENDWTCESLHILLSTFGQSSYGNGFRFRLLEITKANYLSKCIDVGTIYQGMCYCCYLFV